MCHKETGAQGEQGGPQQGESGQLGLKGGHHSGERSGSWLRGIWEQSWTLP